MKHPDPQLPEPSTPVMMWILYVGLAVAIFTMGVERGKVLQERATANHIAQVKENLLNVSTEARKAYFAEYQHGLQELAEEYQKADLATREACASKLRTLAAVKFGGVYAPPLDYHSIPKVAHP